MPTRSNPIMDTYYKFTVSVKQGTVRFLAMYRESLHKVHDMVEKRIFNVNQDTYSLKKPVTKSSLKQGLSTLDKIMVHAV